MVPATLAFRTGRASRRRLVGHTELVTQLRTVGTLLFSASEDSQGWMGMPLTIWAVGAGVDLPPFMVGVGGFPAQP